MQIPQFLISLFRNEKQSRPIIKSVSWADLAQSLTAVQETDCAPCPGKDCPQKYGAAWSPAGYAEGTTERKSANVQSISCAVFDLDDVTADALAGMESALEGFTWLWHTTHSHVPESGKLRVRVVIPLAKPFERGERTNAEFQRHWEIVRAGIIDRFRIAADPACKDLSRLYFRGSQPRGSGSGCGDHSEGLCWDYKRDSGVANIYEQRNRECGLVDQGEYCDGGFDGAGAQIDVSEIKKAIQRILSPQLAKRILSGEPLAEQGARDNTLNQSMSKLAWALPNTPANALIEIMRPSIAAMFPAEGVDHWLAEALDCHRRAVARRGEMRAEEERRERETREAVEDFCKVNTPHSPVSLPRSENWREDLLEYNTAKDGSRYVKSTASNLNLFLRHDPIWKDVFRLNNLTHQIHIGQGPIPCNTKPDSLPAEVADWFAQNEGISLQDHVVKARILATANRNEFDPLLECFAEFRKMPLPKERLIDTWAEKFLGAKTVNESGEDVTDYVRTVTRKWLVGAVARVFEPGCQMDNVLILEGEQRLGKTNVVRALAGKFSRDMKIDMGSKDSLQAISQMHVVELGELSALRNSDVEQHKEFLARKTDFFRPPYGSTTQEYPRRCAFIGTTNPSGGYLKDVTGNTRFWCIACTKIDLVAFRKIVPQLWAEAIEIYFGNETCAQCLAEGMRCDAHNWWLNSKDLEISEKQTEERMEDTGMESRVSKWWAQRALKDRESAFTGSEVAEGVGYPVPQINTGVLGRVGRVLKKKGFVRRRSAKDGWQYSPSQELLGMPYSPFGMVVDTSRKELRS